MKLAGPNIVKLSASPCYLKLGGGYCGCRAKTRTADQGNVRRFSCSRTGVTLALASI